ncbi:hypothetical protein Syun_018395 [Stephania yunnanensis]|uniref:Uncharacterized protein n=1 Tax=Stephania yunnanensis TaxID=152371 RepID=A0AAP0IS57_9MAGN
MISSKSKLDLNLSGLSEVGHNKSSPATPKVSKLGRRVTKSDTDSPSPQTNSRLSIERSPRSVESKPPVDRRSPRVGTSDASGAKPNLRALKGSELQNQLNQAQEDLNKAKEQLSLASKEKAHALEELNHAKKLAEDANEKLEAALAAQKRAEETTEIEKFRADELEQVGIEAVQKKEEEWKKVIESVRNQHAVDVAALLSATQELQRVKQELAMTTDAKNQAMSHADDATKIAEIHADKVELLSAELNRVKALLDSKVEVEANETSELVKKLNAELESLKEELEKAKDKEEKLAEMESWIEQFKIEVETAKKAKADAVASLEEWQAKTKHLEDRVYEAEKLERSASESLSSLMDQLEGKSGSLQDAESEVATLRTRLESLEMSVEEKLQALNNEKLAASSVQDLLEEKNKLINELEASRDEEEKSKKAMESLASALHEVSAEAREAKEKFLSNQTELENAESQVEDLKLVLKATNEKYESMLDEAKHEIDHLTIVVQQSKSEIEDSKAVWDQKELKFVTSMKDLEDESSYLKNEVNRLVGLLKEAQDEAQDANDESVNLQNSLKEAQTEVSSLKGVIDEVKAESSKLKERLLDKENELQSISQENDELRTREVNALKKVEELTKLLEEASAKKEPEENGDVSDSDKDYDMLPKVIEFSEENGERSGEQVSIVETPSQRVIDESPKAKHLPNNVEVSIEQKMENGNGVHKEEGGDTVEVEIKMWDSCKIVEKELSPMEKDQEPEQESNEGESDSKLDDESLLSSTENIDIVGSTSPIKQQSSTQKKKKPLLSKFGNLLKKGSTKSNCMFCRAPNESSDGGAILMSSDLTNEKKLNKAVGGNDCCVGVI